jgi:hypothetical protein
MRSRARENAVAVGANIRPIAVLTADLRAERPAGTAAAGAAVVARIAAAAR